MKSTHEQSSRRPSWSIVTIGIILLLIGITVVNYSRQSKSYEATLIAKDIRTLSEIFARIDARCKIMEFQAQINPINFLNVGSFKGSQVGPMNLAYPTQWQGPYLDSHLTFQDIDYQVVVTKKGHFITPGNGVQLPNGKIVGKDIILTENADIAAMLNDENVFKYKDITLAAPLPLATPLIQKLIMETNVNTAEDMV